MDDEFGKSLNAIEVKARQASDAFLNKANDRIAIMEAKADEIWVDANAEASKVYAKVIKRGGKPYWLGLPVWAWVAAGGVATVAMIVGAAASTSV